MQNQFELPVVIYVRPSPWLAFWIYLIHLGAIPAFIFSGLQPVIQALLICLVLYSLYLTRRRYLILECPTSVYQIMLNEIDEWWLTTEKGTVKAELLPVALVHPLLTILCFQSNSGKYPVILTPDAAQDDDLRRLRVRLKFRLFTENPDDKK